MTEGLGTLVAGRAGAGQGDPVGLHPVRPVRALVEEAEAGDRQPPGQLVQSAGGRQAGACDQVRAAPPRTRSVRSGTLAKASGGPCGSADGSGIR